MSSELAALESSAGNALSQKENKTRNTMRGQRKRAGAA